MNYAALYISPFVPVIVLLGAVLGALVVPLVAVAALAALLLATAVIAVMLAGWVISAPFLAVHAVRERLTAHRVSARQASPQPTTKPSASGTAVESDAEAFDPRLIHMHGFW